MEEMKNKSLNLSEEIFKKNKSGKTAIDLATLGGKVDCLKYFIEVIKQKKYGIEENIEDVLTQQDENGEVLLHSAVLSGNVECFNLTIKIMEEANIDIQKVIRSKNSKKKNLLHLAALSGNKECASVLIELIKKQFNIVDQNLCCLIEKDINGNSIFHMAAISGNKECIEYLTEKTKLVLDISILYPIDVNERITLGNDDGETPLHLASMCFNWEVIQFLCEPMEKAGILTEEINMQSQSGKTPLHYIVADTDDDELKSAIIQEKREENQHMKKKALKSLLYIKKENGKEVINNGVNFDIKDDDGKIALDYVLSNSDTSIMQLFLDAFYELKDELERKHYTLEKKYQERHKWVSRVNSILSSTASIIVTSLILTGMSNTPEKVAASCVAIFCSCVAISLVFFNYSLERKENKLKSKIQNYNKKINQIEKRIEEITGESKKGYRTARERDELLEQIVKMLNINNSREKSDINNSMQECVNEEGETVDTNEQAAREQSICGHKVGNLRRQSHVFLSPRTSVSSHDIGDRSRTSTFSQVNPTSQDTASLTENRSRTSTFSQATPPVNPLPTLTFTNHCDKDYNKVEFTKTRDNGSFRLRTRSDAHAQRGVKSSITEVTASPPISKHLSEIRLLSKLA